MSAVLEAKEKVPDCPVLDEIEKLAAGFPSWRPTLVEVTRWRDELAQYPPEAMREGIRRVLSREPPSHRFIPSLEQFVKGVREVVAQEAWAARQQEERDAAEAARRSAGEETREVPPECLEELRRLGLLKTGAELEAAEGGG